MNRASFDIVVAGSGFSGTITALCLKQLGYKVAITERTSHPRFAIGESSTPVADMVLRSLGQAYDLPFLETLSRYGTWLRHHEDLLCGAKRGFAYYFHSTNTEFRASPDTCNPLYVAASKHRPDSDTHWYRADIDEFLAKKAVDYGIDLHENSRIESIQLPEKGSSASVQDSLIRVRLGNAKGERTEWVSRWLIDATGSSQLANTHLGIGSSTTHLRTSTEAVYTHLDHTSLWKEIVDSECLTQSEYPFSPDESALHHMIIPGWVWNLRFRDNRLSCGLVIDRTTHHNWLTNCDPEQVWQKTIDPYPSLIKLFNSPRLSDPPGRWFRTPRLQRQLDRFWNRGWVALPSTAGFVDPLHSTGIAHSLTGIESLLAEFKASPFRMMSSNSNEPLSERANDAVSHSLDNYESRLRAEFTWIDKLVSFAYQTRHNSRAFHTAVMLYFIATVSYEQKRITGDRSDYYLSANQDELIRAIDRSIKGYVPQRREFSVDQWVHQVRTLIKPWNVANLLAAHSGGKYWHTAVELNSG